MKIHNEPIFAILLVGGALIHIVLLIVVIEVVIRLAPDAECRGADRARNSAQRRLKDTQNRFH